MITKAACIIDMCWCDQGVYCIGRPTLTSPSTPRPPSTEWAGHDGGPLYAVPPHTRASPLHCTHMGGRMWLSLRSQGHPVIYTLCGQTTWLQVAGKGRGGGAGARPGEGGTLQPPTTCSTNLQNMMQTWCSKRSWDTLKKFKVTLIVSVER